MILAALTLSGAIAAGESGAMLPSASESVSIGYFTAELYPMVSREGSQSWVRKYEGQRDRVWSLGTFSLLGYDNEWQYFVYGSDIFSGNTALNAELGSSDNFWAQLYTTSVTRRIPVFYPNLVPTADVLSIVSSPPKTGQPATFLGLLPPNVMAPAREHFNDVVPLNAISPASQFRIDRAEDSAKVELRPFKSEKVELFGDAWRADQNGARPLLFRARTGNSPTTATGGVSTPGFSGVKFQTTEPVDSTTAEAGGGLNVTLGPALISYKGYSSSYDNRVTGPIIPAGFDGGVLLTEPIVSSRFDNTRTKNQVAKLAVPLGSKLSLTGNWINRDRTHETNRADVTSFTGVPGDVTAQLRTTMGSLAYTPISSLLFTAKVRKFDLDRNAPVIPSGAAQLNTSIMRHEKEGELEGSFTGIRSTLFRGSYKMNNTTRDVTGTELIEENVETSEHPAVAPRTNTRTWKLGARTYLIPKVSLRADWKNMEVTRGNPAFHGMPSNSRNLGAGLSYTPKEDLGLYADWRRIDDRNRTIPAPGFLTVAAPGGATEVGEYEEAKEDSAGAQFQNKTDSLVLGLYKTLGQRLSLDANYMYDKIGSRAFWILGSDPTNAPNVGGQGDTTGLGPERVPYNAKDRIMSAGLTYAASRKLSLRGNAMYGKSDGVISTSSLFRLVTTPAPVTGTVQWQPFDTRYWRVGIGLAYRWTMTQQITFDVSRNVWDDRVESAFNGKYTLVTVGLVTKF